MFRKILLLSVIVLSVSILLISAQSGGNAANLYDESARLMSTFVNKPYSVQFNASAEFDSIELYILNAATGKPATLELSLYKWDTNYQTTLKSTPIISEEIEEGIKSRTWLKWDLNGKMPLLPEAGEYVVHIEKSGEGTLTFNVANFSYSKVRLYESYAERGGSLQMRINYTKGGGGLEDISDNIVVFNEDFDRYAATDGLGRVLPGYKEAGPVREGKYVGIFFHTWHDWNASRGTRNITEILKEHPDIVNDYNSLYWGDSPVYHWNEPIYNYYKNTDRWVLRKQAELLAEAGVDVIIFDNTNGATTYLDVVEVLLEEFAKARQDGVKTPQISFLMNFFESSFGDTVKQLKELYNAIYRDGRYKDLWFYWKGKPLMMAYPDKLNENDPLEKEIKEFFTFRPGQPSYTMGQQFVGQWGWLSIYPQQVYYNEDGTPEQITVGVAQNHSKKRGLTAFNGEGVFGRTWSGKLDDYDKRENAKLYGANFAEQFEYALEVDPEFIFITGWNEWVVSRYKEWGGVVNAFPDSFNDEYSRDIEPSRGDLKDHYYYQMVSYIRRFKGVKPPMETGDKKAIDIYSDEDQWADVLPEFKAYPGNTVHRDSSGYINNETRKTYRYSNTTGRNDIRIAKVARDDKFVYFMVECVEDITPPTDEKWMRLFLDINGKETANWETFNYVVNRVNPVNNKAVLEKSTGGYNWEKVGEVDFSLKGKRLQIKIPKSMLGIKGDKFTINFKWSDNMQVEGDIMDFYVNGDAAPVGRYKFQYTTIDAANNKRSGKVFVYAGGALVLCALALTGFIIARKKKRANKG
jgi:hypothetical protein